MSPGNFSSPLHPTAPLVFSNTGFFQQEIAVGGQTGFTVKLKENAKALDEAVFIGYQKLRKSDLTGAVSSVKAKVLNLSAYPQPGAGGQGGRRTGIAGKRGALFRREDYGCGVWAPSMPVRNPCM